MDDELMRKGNEPDRYDSDSEDQLNETGPAPSASISQQPSKVVGAAGSIAGSSSVLSHDSFELHRGAPGRAQGTIRSEWSPVKSEMGRKPAGSNNGGGSVASKRPMTLEEELKQMEKFEFPEELESNDDSVGVSAFVARSKQFPFFMFPVAAVSKQLDCDIFNISHQGFGNQCVIALSDALKRNTFVRRIIVRDNGITYEGAAALFQVFRYNKIITEIDLADNSVGMGRPVTAPPLGSIMEGIFLHSCPLTILRLKGNKLTDSDIIAFSDMLMANMSLTEVDLSYNKIGEAGGVALGVALEANQRLTDLNLGWNNIMSKGFAAIARGVSKSTTLRKLDVAWNGIGDDVGDDARVMISENSSLVELRLSKNRIGTKCALKIAEALQVNSGLRTIMLDQNPLRDEGLIAIFESLRTNRSIDTLLVQRTEGGDAAKQRLSDVINAGRSLRYVML